MKANVSFSGSTLSISVDIEGILDGATDEELADLAQSLSCRDAIVKAVCDQLCEGWTENGSYSGDTTLAAARRSVIDRIEQFQTMAHRDRKRNAEQSAHRAYLDGVYAGLEALCGPRHEWGDRVCRVRDAVVNGFDGDAYEVR